MNTTLDGFIAGADDGLDWHFERWTDEMAIETSEQLSEADTIVLGRVTYKGMAAYWPHRSIDLCAPRQDVDFTDMMNSYTKVVFSKTMKRASWNNSKIIKSNIAEAINVLRNEKGRDLIIYGSAGLVNSLQKLELIDEYRVWLHPVLLGQGKMLFNGMMKKVNLNLYKTKRFSSGVILLCYQCI